MLHYQSIQYLNHQHTNIAVKNYIYPKSHNKSSNCFIYDMRNKQICKTINIARHLVSLFYFLTETMDKVYKNFFPTNRKNTQHFPPLHKTLLAETLAFLIIWDTGTTAAKIILKTSVDISSNYNDMENVEKRFSISLNSMVSQYLFLFNILYYI